MNKALIGHTGFVGSNILRGHKFEGLYNSKNIEYIQNKDYDLIICAGVPAEKWKANKEPYEDWKNIDRLIGSLEKVTAKKFILISTIDVYPNLTGVNEDSIIDKTLLNPYGLNRRLLEEFVQERFNSTIIRLPGLFGRGLKKNFIFDMINGKNLDKTHQDGVFQYYPIKRLVEDIFKIKDTKIELINLVTEPISIKEISEKVFGFEFKNNLLGDSPRYDVRTKHANKWDETNYLYNKEIILDDLKQFVGEQNE